MALNKKVEEALNKQLNAEFFSYYLYLGMAAFFDSGDLKGFGSWMRVQAKEEMAHAMKIFEFVLERKGKISLSSISEPKATIWATPTKALEEAFEHEKKVSKMINELFELSQQEKDHATTVFLQWFVTEQVEEEANADQTLQKARMIAESKAGIYILDQEMAKRTKTQ